MKSYEKKTILALILISSLSAMSGSMIAPVEVRFVNMLANNNTFLTGITFATGTLLLFLFSIYLGRKSIVYGKGKLALVGLGVGIVYPVIYATSLNLFQYVFGKVAWSIAAVSSSTIINAVFQDVISRSKRIAEISGYRFSAQSIAGSIGAVVGGFLADAYSITMSYYAILPLYMISLVVFLKYVYPEIKGNTVLDSKVRERKVKESLGEIVSNPFLFFRLFTEGITQSHWAIEPIIFPLAIYSITGSNVSTGIVFAGMGMIAMFMLPITGKFVDRTSPITGLKVAFALYVIALIILSSAKSYPAFLTGALLLSAGKTFNGPSVAKIEVSQIKSDVRGEYLGYFNAYDTVTGVVAATITGYMLKYIDYWQVLFIFAVFTFVGFVSGYMILKTKLKNQNI